MALWRQIVLLELGRRWPAALVAAGLLLATCSAACSATVAVAPGFRQLEGRHLTLITDLGPKEDLDDLPKTFDAAFPLWCRYFGLDEARLADWHVTGYLMKSRERFEQAGYWESGLPPFPNGFSAGQQFWLYDQKSPYYRQHLLLHEGVHSFMYLLLGQAGPPGFMEGMAELLATHHWHDGQLEVGYFPIDPQDVLQWGRIEIMRGALQAGHARALGDVLTMRGVTVVDNDVYGWSWGLAAFLDGHPRYRERFRTLGGSLRGGNFEAEFRRLYAPDWHDLSAEWQAFVSSVDYGYDFARMAIAFRGGEPLSAGQGRAKIDVAHGWQSSALRLEAGKTYELSATGRYQIAGQPAAWWCEPGGVTIRYYRGRPLGILLAAVDEDPEAGKTAASADAPAEALPDAAADVASGSWTQPLVVGLRKTFTPTRGGTLYLRINEPAGELADNSGSIEVVVREIAAGP